MMGATVINAICTAIADCATFYAIKYPDENDFHFGAQTSECKAKTQFKIAPFDTTRHSVITIQQQHCAEEFIELPREPHPCNSIESTIVSKEDYLLQAAQIINDINNGLLQKAILSYPITRIHNATPQLWCSVLYALANKYRNAVIFIFNSPETGFWLGASPEILAEYSGNHFHTMALAGTLKIDSTDKWSVKEIEEQAIVRNFIENIITSRNCTPIVAPLYCKQAGPVQHLCNDIVCNCSLDTATALVELLHPTPALGGFPQDKAVGYIQEVERHDRKYYGGYLGEQTESSFKFSVNLRSLAFDSTKYTIYVGGGITADSTPYKEWAEIMAKANTLTSVLDEILDK